MKGLDRVTITGADDSIAAHELKALSRDFPFVEWGILFSMTQQGSPRFPTERWIEHLPEGLNYAAHLCGRYVRDVVLDAKFRWLDSGYNRPGIFQRVQLNFHGQFHKAHPDLESVLRFYADYKFIFQCDGVNDDSVLNLCITNEDQFSPLFDTSGGAGILPESWPNAWSGTYCGYAGGLGPDNVIEQLHAIEPHVGGRCSWWIDMERRVRSDDDTKFDLAKVRAVLEACAPLLGAAR